MLQRGDYVVPWFNGLWRFDKPILIYWFQSASYRLFGDNAFAARLPSVLFTTATALLLVRWGRKIADARTAFLAGAMFIAGLHVALIGRVATADMAMIFFFTLAVWSGWELTRPENPSRKTWWVVFYVALALGFLAKGGSLASTRRNLAGPHIAQGLIPPAGGGDNTWTLCDRRVSGSLGNSRAGADAWTVLGCGHG